MRQPENLNLQRAHHEAALLAEGKDGSSDRIVMHVDFDYFYAQCEELRTPAYKNLPVVVCVFSGRTEDSGVVSTANYVARTYNVKSGIPIKTAKSRLAAVGEAVFLPVDMQYYSELSEKAMSLIESRGGTFEKVGIDECFIDASNTAGSYDEAKVLAEKIKAAVRDRLGLTCSVGVAPNKMLAKIASDFKKPDGLTLIEPSLVREFIAGLDVEKISGIGPKTKARLAEMGVTTVGQLTKIDQFKLVEEFGKKAGTFIYDSARGIDNEPVVDGREKKQIGRIMTLKNDAYSSRGISGELSQLCESVFSLATTRNLAFKTVGVLIILSDLEQRSKSKSLKVHATSFDLLHATAQSLLEDLMDGRPGLKVRRLGVQVSDFHDTVGQNTMSQFMGG